MATNIPIGSPEEQQSQQKIHDSRGLRLEKGFSVFSLPAPAPGTTQWPSLNSSPLPIPPTWSVTVATVRVTSLRAILPARRKSLPEVTKRFRVNHVDRTLTRCEQNDVNQQLYQRHASISKTK